MGRVSTGVWLLTVAAVLAFSPVTPAQIAQPPAPAAGARVQANPGDRPAAPAAKPAATLPRIKYNPNDPRMKQVLHQWEQQSALLKSLDVGIKRTDKDPDWQAVEEYSGRAFLKSPNLACLDFRKLTKDAQGKPVLSDYERIICTGTDVWQYRSDTHQVFIFPLDKENQKSALEQGPLPFLFNMKAADAEARYMMTIVREEKGYFVIGVLPKYPIDKESFSQAFVQLNRATFLPDRIFLISPNQKSTKDFELKDVRPNANIHPDNFKGRVPPKGWQVVRDPGDQGGGRPQTPRLGNQARPPRVGAQPPAAAPGGAMPGRR